MTRSIKLRKESSVLSATTSRDAFSSLRRAALNKQPISGLTHRFYRYPARFSPIFARVCIETFSEPGDFVLDPYMGGGTTVVEATRILEITDVNNQQEEVRIFLNGQCHKQVLVYESFKLVPFALISNAVKYRLIGPVRVFIFEHARTVEVSVESQGPAIEPDELDGIFLKRKRGKWGEKVASGTGVGLYLAKIAAYANDNDFAIRVYSVKQAGRTERGVPVANNKFTFELPFAA